jgi:uncharacterized membrane protein YeaQ/YmgE (transglycosylase-associated protein family)
MDLLFWIVFGLVVGVIAQQLYPYPRYGVLGSIVLGILGAILGGWVGQLLFGVGVSGFNLSSFIVAIIGSVIVIWLARRF